MHTDTEAIVLRRFDFSETSQIGHFLTRDLGRVSGLAKGIKRPNATLKGPMDLFQRAKVRLVRRPDSDLFLVAHYEPVTIHAALRDRLARLYGAFYWTEILYDGVRELDADPELFDLAAAGLRALEDAPEPGVVPLVAALELKLLDRIGFRPAIENCARCGNRRTGNRGTFHPIEGGIVCADCRRPGMAGIDLDGAALAVLQGLLKHPLSFAERLRLSAAQAQGLRTITHALTNAVLERLPLSQRFLGAIVQASPAPAPRPARRR